MEGRGRVRRISTTTIKLKWKDEDGGTTAALASQQTIFPRRANSGSSMYRRIRGRTRNGCKVRLGATQQSNGCNMEYTGLPRRTRRHGIDVFAEEDMATRNCRKQQHSRIRCNCQEARRVRGTRQHEISRRSRNKTGTRYQWIWECHHHCF